MNDQERELLMEEFKRIRDSCPQGRPQGSDLPDWNGETVPSLPEFFNGTAHLWDEIYGASGLHVNTAAQIPETRDAITILDVGCGTGLEFEYVFQRAPNAQILGLDQAPRMLDQVRRKYSDRMNQITLIESSCLDWPSSLSDFDFVISCLTVHHFPPDVKRVIYRSIRAALKDSGAYIEGDQSSPSPEREAGTMNVFNAWIAKLPDGRRGGWNFDVTLTVETNTRLLRETGFTMCEVKWEKRDERGRGDVVIVAR